MGYLRPAAPLMLDRRVSIDHPSNSPEKDTDFVMNVMGRGYQRVALAALLIAAGCSGDASDWVARNDRMVRDNNVTGREREIPTLNLPMVLDPGTPAESSTLPTVTIAPGVTARVGWSSGALLEQLEMEANSSYPEQLLDEELIVIGREGTATVTFDGQTVELQKDDVLYLEPGTNRSVQAGAEGWRAYEIFSPVRLDHLALAGQDTAGVDVSFPDEGVTPSLQQGVVVSLNNIQWTPVMDPITGVSYTRSTGQSKVFWGRNTLISMIRMDPGSSIPLHIHPEEQLTLTTRGSLQQGVMDEVIPASGAAGHMLYLPSGMVHSAELEEFGADQLDVFWPVRPDYVERALAQQALFDEVIDPSAEPTMLADGFTFAEGPTWLRGRLYFSDMYFANPAAGDWTGDPARSRLISMAPNGQWNVLSSGMQTNGTIGLANGNLLVADMFGHRVVEVNPSNGSVVRVVLDEVNGAPIDGPNDMVMDAKGGVYVTDPQFTPEADKSQPGTQVYYIRPDGTATIVVGPGEYAMPNGVEISPDGRTLYINNSWAQPGENFVFAYDVAEDGTLSNKREFANLNLTPEVLEAENPVDRFDSGADGTAVDTDGRYYVATRSGVQIFMPDGKFVGTIHFPQYPVSITFGGPNNDILYMVGESSVWSIPTKVRGFRLPEGLN